MPRSVGYATSRAGDRERLAALAKVRTRLAIESTGSGVSVAAAQK
jgi:hypothetical protein